MGFIYGMKSTFPRKSTENLFPYILIGPVIGPLILMNVDQIFTKSAKILTIYVKNRQIHVENFQKCHFLKKKQKKSTSKITQNKNPTSKINQDLGGGYWGIGWGGALGYIWGGNIGVWGG